MAFFRGPKIVTDGLVMSLDVGNIKSYPGSGTVWTDLINNTHFNSNGTQTPLTTVNGVTCFDFNGSGYWECSDFDSKKVDMTGDFTLIIWYYSETMSIRKSIFEKAANIYTSYSQEIAVTIEPPGTFATYYRGYNVSSTLHDYATGQSWSNNAWHQIAITCKYSPRSGYTSIDGKPWVSGYTYTPGTTITQASSVRIGTGYTGVMTNGYISTVYVYNKTFTDADINQNYNAIKTRFGL